MSSWRTAPRFQTMFFILAVLLLNPFLASAQTIVAIIDTGVNELHPDLTGQVTGGFDFVDNDGLADDRVGHGTELAGVVAANGAIQGVCITCQVMPLKVTDHTLADQDLIAQAITYAVANGAQVVLIGVGAIGNYSAVATAIATAEAAGIVVIAPAGSEELAHTLYPAALPTVVSVVGVDSSGVFLRMSNTSGRETVAAIGKNVETTGLLGFSVPRTGSSIAAAFVAGIAGRLLGAEPGLTPVQVRQILKHGVDPVPIPRWYDYFDYGIANIDSALARASATFKDVAVKRLSVFPNSPLTGQSHFVRVEISNMGNVTSDSVFLDVTHNGLPVGSTVELAPLDAGETVLADVNLPTVFAPSTVDVSATVQTQAAENRTANNTLLVSVVYTGVAVHDVDMIVGEISEPVIEAANIHVPIKLRNRGNQGETVTVTAYMDDIPFS
ncbi:MAG: S8 family serine peptidase, partial [Candidatus Krumholzibacteria bacterium]|nr:S8 family serine peptidase [Candidatus Krumholzibacteria bacterium]